MKRQFIAQIISIGLLIFGAVACTQMPTEKQGIVDLRPQLSFKISDETLRAARVLIDGLDVGTAADYENGSAALRLLSGRHLIRVDLNGRNIVDEKIYIGDGVHQTILVK